MFLFQPIAFHFRLTQTATVKSLDMLSVSHPRIARSTLRWMCVNLIACGFCVSIRLLFQEEYDLEANHLLKGMYAYNIIKSVTELAYISEDRVNEVIMVNKLFAVLDS
ncbi:hypothetical protein AVEN_264223-1 [Araneus ventricosus]|uniref:Uncharacterized protein n=1 Tax=Araneus ventricosus TaxID=182803 RepID=A0A4Y2J2L2_ARAVE|nr:hypothetical protein AVEN_264223-1 [Araneus ventricosus]